MKYRSFKSADYVHIRSPRRPGLSKKFHRSSTGPFEITAKIYLNYKISIHNERKCIVRVNRLKPAYNAVIKSSYPRPIMQRRKRTHEASLCSESCKIQTPLHSENFNCFLVFRVGMTSIRHAHSNTSLFPFFL